MLTFCKLSVTSIMSVSFDFIDDITGLTITRTISGRRSGKTYRFWKKQPPGNLYTTIRLSSLKLILFNTMIIRKRTWKFSEFSVDLRFNRAYYMGESNYSQKSMSGLDSMSSVWKNKVSLFFGEINLLHQY